MAIFLAWQGVQQGQCAFDGPLAYMKHWAKGCRQTYRVDSNLRRGAANKPAGNRRLRAGRQGTRRHRDTRQPTNIGFDRGADASMLYSADGGNLRRIRLNKKSYELPGR